MISIVFDYCLEDDLKETIEFLDPICKVINARQFESSSQADAISLLLDF